MKKTLFVLMMASLTTGCHHAQRNKASKANADSTIYYPYAPLYTSAFEKGSDLYARSVLEIWRQYETGNVPHAADHFADSITIILPDKIFTGEKDSILALLQKRRASYADLQSYVDAWMPVRAKDNGDDLVFVWGRLDATLKNGKRDYMVIHEIWRMNKQGKVRRMEQYLTHPY